MKSLKFIFSAMILFISFNIYSQFSISYYGGSENKVGVAYNSNKRIWLEITGYQKTVFKLSSNNIYIDKSIYFEGGIYYNFFKTDYLNFNTGVCGYVDDGGYYWGLGIMPGIQVFPLQNFKNLSLHIETFLYFDDYEEFNLKNYWGIRYTF